MKGGHSSTVVLDRVLIEILEMKMAEVFFDEAGVKRIRLTPKGMRAARIPEDEIAAVIIEEERLGRPYSPEVM